jgi:hypothetical protein
MKKYRVDFMARVSIVVDAIDEDDAAEVAQSEILKPNNLRRLADDAEITDIMEEIY